MSATLPLRLWGRVSLHLLQLLGAFAAMLHLFALSLILTQAYVCVCTSFSAQQSPDQGLF